jgi:hypothetical protein
MEGIENTETTIRTIRICTTFIMYSSSNNFGK